MENKNPTNLDYEVMKQKLKEQLRTGKSLFSKGGAFAPLLEELINSMLEGELEGHLDEDERRNGNRKNDKGSKIVKTSAGSIEINTPRDRLGSFEPEIIKKRETERRSWLPAWKTRSSVYTVLAPVCAISARTSKRPTTPIYQLPH